jgi:hypothetical protein
MKGTWERWRIPFACHRDTVRILQKLSLIFIVYLAFALRLSFVLGFSIRVKNHIQFAR